MMKQIADLNTNAIAQIQNGDYNEAILMLREALVPLKDQMERNKRSACEIRSEEICRSGRAPDSRNILVYTVPISEYRDIDGSTLYTPDNLFPFYQRAFLFSDIDQSGTDISQCTVACVIILYNIGLAFHKDAICRKSAKKYARALEFYGMAMSVIQNEWANVEPTTVLILLALTNNMGHIHSHFLNFQETQSSIQYLKDLMMHFGSSIIMTEDDDYAFFTKAVTIFQQQNFVGSPAA